jgi:hypothetical protein
MAPLSTGKVWVMSSQINRHLLYQQWVHAHEEDTPTEAVYRPASYPLPRSRGRTGFELRPDGTMRHVGIGPTDLPQETAGSWGLEEDDVPRIRIRLHTGDTQELPILSVEQDRLVVRK